MVIDGQLINYFHGQVSKETCPFKWFFMVKKLKSGCYKMVSKITINIQVLPIYEKQ
jgi:hypothetical protein